MTKIDFTKLPCYTGIDKQYKAEQNLKNDFANMMYMQGSGVAMGALAIKIYNSQGPEEYNEQECQLMLQIASMCNPVIFDSLQDIIALDSEG